MISQVFKKTLKSLMIVKCSQTKLNVNHHKKKKIMKMRNKKMNGKNQMKIKMKMAIKTRMKKTLKMKAMENKNQKNMMIKIQMKEQMIHYLSITKKLNRSKILLKSKPPRMKMKKNLRMKYQSFRDKAIIEATNITNQIIQKLTIWEINITLSHQDSYYKLLRNLIKLMLTKISIKVHQRKQDCLKVIDN